MSRASESLPRVLLLGPVAALLVTALGAKSGAQTELPAAAPSIRAVRYHVEPGRTRVWFETSGPTFYTHYSPDPLTLVIDLPGVDISQIPDRTVVGSREVESILANRLGAANGKVLSRLEIKLGSLVPYQISTSDRALTVLFENASAAEPLAPPSAASGAPSPPTPPAPPARASAGESAAAPAMRAEPKRELKAEPTRPPPASAIRSISHVVSDDLLTVKVGADGRLSYTSFRLENPARLVFDFSGVLNRVAQPSVAIGAVGVARARVAQYRPANPSITRVVFDLNGSAAHRVVEEGGSFRVYFAASPERLARAVPLASMEAETSQTEQPAPAPPLPTSEPVAAASGAELAPVPATEPTPELPKEAASFEPVAVVAAYPLTEPPQTPSLPLPDPAGEPAQPPAPGQVQPGAPPSFQPRTIGAEEKVYTGELISLDFKDGDIQDIFRLFAEISGLNVVLQPGVSGRVTLKLNEVPWDQALELVLKTNKLGYIQEGNVIRIAPLSQLAEEETERRKLAEEKALAGELNTYTKPLSYAKAKSIEPLVKRNLSPRGDIVIDERTNTLIITDLPNYLTNVDALIQTLDTAIPGVEIEGRVVVTTRTFSRQLGIQWGFTGAMNQQFGNTTELVFPNSIEIGGQPIGSDAVDEFKTLTPEFGGGLRPPQVDLRSVTDAQRGYAVNLPFAAAPTGAIGVSLGSITGAFSIDAALSAAEQRGHVRILSSPKIVTQNNKAATIRQGVQFPIQVVANNTVTIQFKDAVLELEVTPQITSAETIILDLKVNNDSLDFGRAVQGVPSVVTQSATTQVLVSDGSTTVIGGVFVNTEQKSDRYVPLLHRIPILGHLFKSGDTSSRNEELLIFITPRIRKGSA
jgi:type IV pilus assembly protein PilQ